MGSIFYWENKKTWVYIILTYPYIKHSFVVTLLTHKCSYLKCHSFSNFRFVIQQVISRYFSWGLFRFSGPTIHYVDEEYDRGRILAQRIVPVLANDTAEELAGRVLHEVINFYILDFTCQAIL